MISCYWCTEGMVVWCLCLHVLPVVYVLSVDIVRVSALNSPWDWIQQ